MSRRIFRPTALRHYNDSLDKLVLPRYATPPWPAVLWGLVGLLLALMLLLWAAPMPLYVTGPGVVVQRPEGFAAENEAILVVFLPPEAASHVRPKQPALVYLSAPGGAAAGQEIRLTGVVAVIEPGVTAPAAVRARYGLDGSTGLLVTGPTVVALIRLDIPARTMLGSFGEVQIETGAQRGLALLPGIGPFFRFDSHPSK
jgi:hypothetical protein